LARDIPNRQAVEDIINKRKDKNGNNRQVPRKYLLLFFLLNYENDDFEETKEAADELLENCGMPWLDTRNPFDFIYLHSLFYSTLGEDYAMASDRLSELAGKIDFAGEDDNEG
jgi:hypothetical protein